MPSPIDLDELIQKLLQIRQQNSQKVNVQIFDFEYREFVEIEEIIFDTNNKTILIK